MSTAKLLSDGRYAHLMITVFPEDGVNTERYANLLAARVRKMLHIGGVYVEPDVESLGFHILVNRKSKKYPSIQSTILHYSIDPLVFWSHTRTEVERGNKANQKKRDRSRRICASAWADPDD